nr:non-canonical purine NTP pyrophosphatase [Pseudomonas fluorescens]
MFKIIFLTSSKVKMSHFAYLLRDYDVELMPPPDYGKPYIEPRIYDRQKLLELSLTSANQRLARKAAFKDESDTITLPIDLSTSVENFFIPSDHQNRIFFLEDTSVVIEALSRGKEYPGVDIKYWMRDNDFESVDKQLKRRKNNRRVSVRSDLVLYLPPVLRDKNEGAIYKVFTGKSEGYITEVDESFEVNSLYPWLDNKTFNKWFVPDGEVDVISRLPIEVALKHDFRKKALGQMLEFLESKKIVRKTEVIPQQIPYSQIELFPSSDFIFCGPTCSGKTVLAFFISKKFGYLHIEASDFMKKVFHERHGLDSSLDIHIFAKETLISDPGIIANQVADYILKTQPYRFVVTGFRSSEEIKVLQGRLNRQDIKLVYIDAPVDVRFLRNKARARSDVAGDINEFIERNAVQDSMGLSGIKKISIVVENDSTLFRYLRSMIRRFVPAESHIDNIRHTLDGVSTYLSLEKVILISLLLGEQSGKTPLTTSEIARSITASLLCLRVKADGVVVLVNKNNVSRYFNQRFSVNFKVVKVDKVVKYQLSQTGKSAAVALLKELSAGGRR